MSAVLEATRPPEARGLARDGVRLLVSSSPDDHRHATFRDLSTFLREGDLVVVNESATLPASLPTDDGLLLNLSTRYGAGLWLVEPRWSHDRPGPLPVGAGWTFRAGGVPLRLVAPFPGIERLWFASGDARAAMRAVGRPIRYGYSDGEWPLASYQTIFARRPGSAEMPSAGRPFTLGVVDDLRARGVRLATITLHCGVSSLELDDIGDAALPPEAFSVPRAAAAAVNATRARGGRVVAVGTTVVRALESAWDGENVVPGRGFTRLVVSPRSGVHAVDGLVTGLHEPTTTHLWMLHAIGGERLVKQSYGHAEAGGYLWHEFGDSHLILPNRQGGAYWI